jgi:hypothetical protein
MATELAQIHASGSPLLHASSSPQLYHHHHHHSCIIITTTAPGHGFNLLPPSPWLTCTTDVTYPASLLTSHASIHPCSPPTSAYLSLPPPNPGGGAVKNPINWSYLHAGVVIWLDGEAELLARRVVKDGLEKRPLLFSEGAPAEGQVEATTAKVGALLEERKKFYENADIKVSLKGYGQDAELGAPTAVIMYRWAVGQGAWAVALDGHVACLVLVMLPVGVILCCAAMCLVSPCGLKLWCHGSVASLIQHDCVGTAAL